MHGTRADGDNDHIEGGVATGVVALIMVLSVASLALIALLMQGES